MDWADSEKFDSQKYPGYRVSYFNGIITLVSQELASFVNRGLAESPLSIKSDFLKSLEQLDWAINTYCC